MRAEFISWTVPHLYAQLLKAPSDVLFFWGGGEPAVMKKKRWLSHELEDLIFYFLTLSL
jgi:hypothetical protein